MQWLYNSDQNEQKVAIESDIPGLVNRGSIRADTLVWNNQLPDWTKASVALPYLFPVSSPVGLPVDSPPRDLITRPNSEQEIRHLSLRCREMGRILDKASGWLQFLGVVYALSFFYIIPIFMAIKCFSIASGAKAVAKSGNYEQLNKILKEVRDLFVLQGVVVLVAVVFHIVIIILTLSAS